MPIDLNTINSYTNTNTETSREVNNNLGKDEFLNLLVTQMSNQDPLKPTSDTEFIAQMAQFSSLEQMQNLNASITSQTAYSLIGKEISASSVYDAVDKTTLAADITGNVVGINKISGTEYLTVYETKTGDYYYVPIESVEKVSQGVNVMDQITALTGLVQQLVTNTAPAEAEAPKEADNTDPVEGAAETPEANQ